MMMLVHGCDCSLVMKTASFIIDVPYVSETVREDITLLYEEATIEGDGTVKAMRKFRGTVGCVVTPLTMNTTPFLFCLAFGFREKPVFVSETRNMYKHCLRLVHTEDSESFDVIQTRKRNETLLFEGCHVCSFELRIEREQSIKLRMDIVSERSPSVYSYDDRIPKECGERFQSDYVTYRIKDTSTGSVSEGNTNIYGVTIVCKKENETKTELWIRRSLENGSDIPAVIDEMIITARLLRDKYEDRCYGTFSITLKKIVMISDETNIESSDAVLGQLRYFVNGSVSADVYTSGEKVL